MTVFETEIISIGSEAELFKDEKMLILFGKNAPDTLKDYCYNIKVNPVNGSITTDATLMIGDAAFKITSVGDVVQKNLEDLGHITIKFDGSTIPELPGTLYVEDKELPELAIGTSVIIQ
ncbi:PTS glucitol/sorbitol transporter subunit IIA [Tetragenococcus koreensis]|uniref:PTS glucitol/sorbitol transporter subunit IIA n=1 Tax=Tetragenococcus koreensis TaxID=290335 RepID=UPI001F3EB146|nr:PTS glucitol/sorbitol transporter subunit IIA [Tetragenococcus koreensis]MDN6640859.1 PTS glucitol/sorbitol transporter subunit IIA [Tetragenococcus sp.]MCF1585870.1 PTS glucitol/sorbitol transporter subunit IIA [Tetragenococcus koreensis]MCF1615440.1 PTS glucitol/sorbitol transporter subunit IIA [Tetragenococcus koreensis]MCF1619169.1 PTS glucitol/sorbitol transporter subunit IIA [Tetragenococcus koreensis]MCF1625237.1 PTS glucitol/sorbitol transporter subunit IIA [Tetragenococcus koreensi